MLATKSNLASPLSISTAAELAGRAPRGATTCAESLLCSTAAFHVQVELSVPHLHAARRAGDHHRLLLSRTLSHMKLQRVLEQGLAAVWAGRGGRWHLSSLCVDAAPTQARSQITR